MRLLRESICARRGWPMAGLGVVFPTANIRRLRLRNAVCMRLRTSGRCLTLKQCLC